MEISRIFLYWERIMVYLYDIGHKWINHIANLNTKVYVVYLENHFSSIRIDKVEIELIWIKTFRFYILVENLNCIEQRLLLILIHIEWKFDSSPILKWSTTPHGAYNHNFIAAIKIHQNWRATNGFWTNHFFNWVVVQACNHYGIFELLCNCHYTH